MRFEGWPAWLKIAAVCAVGFFVAYGLLALEAWRTGAQGTGRPTTHSAGSSGYKALYLWLKTLGVPVQRWEKPFGDLSPSITVVVVFQPEIGLDPGELQALESWVRQGGTLIVSAAPPDMIMKHFGLGEEPISPEGRRERRHKVLFQPGPYTRGYREILSNGHPGLTSSKPEMVVHVRDEWGGLIGSLREGKGRVIAVADPMLFTNGSLRKGDHARLALDILLCHLGDGALVVDEYHHGYGRATTVVGHFLRSSASEPLLQGLVFLLVLWLAMGRRFGATRPPVIKGYRSSMESVKAMAQLFQRGQARGYALERILGFVEEESRRLLLGADRGLKKTLHSARQRLQGGKLTDGELLGEVRHLYAALDKARRVEPGERKR